MKPTRAVFGFHAVLARLRADAASVTEIYLDEDRKDARAKDLALAAEKAGVSLMRVPTKRLDGFYGGDRTQGPCRRHQRGGIQSGERRGRIRAVLHGHEPRPHAGRIEGARHLDRRRGRARGKDDLRVGAARGDRVGAGCGRRGHASTHARALRPPGAHSYARERRKPERLGGERRVPVRVAAATRVAGPRRLSTAAISSISDAALFDLGNGTAALAYQ